MFRLNKGMTVDEFKNIFWFEYAHRMMGRFIGAFVALPGLYFIARGYVNPSIRNRIMFLIGMVGCQGLLGWYMVKSGLDHSIIENREVPRVSQYRLAAHLACAFVINMGSLGLVRVKGFLGSRSIALYRLEPPYIG